MTSSSSSSSPQLKDENHAFSGIEPEGIRRKVSKSTTLYDVFINHRGPDSKYSLALPLYTSLKELGIRAFLDLEEMELGNSFPSTIETAITSAAVHIAIFSKRYAESPWCLAELLLMLHSPAKIIPVFYEVEPWKLRHIEKGVYADAFIQHQSKSRYLDKLKQWKEALQSISFTTGYEMNNSNIGDHESILSAVQREVQRIKPLHVARYPVALDKIVQDFEKRCLHNLVEEVEIHCGMNKEEEGKPKIVGIFGMGGVGKTTLSKELFNRKRQQYDRACFLFDVRESSDRCNLPSLQTKLLKDLFGKSDLCFQSTEEGLSCISNCIKRSSSLSFLIVLDDIDHLKQLDDFSIMDILERSANSLVIITTRDVGILVAKGINIGYHLKGMDKDDARQLFSCHAFSQPHPARGYEDLVDDFLTVCGGLPLSLQVLGSHVHGRNENYWRLELQKLGNTMHQDIRKNLKISFDALDMEEKQIFMDMACFFVDQSKCIAIRVWKASGWSAEKGLQALKDKCLVEEIEDTMPVLRMHDHLRDLGREMANELSQPPRLWHPQDLKKLEAKGFENIIAQTKARCFHSIFDKSLNSEVKFFLGGLDHSTEMSCLLWLHLCYPYLYYGSYSSNLNYPSHMQHKSLSAQPEIPPWIPLQNMQCLRISNGYFKRLWQDDVEAPSELRKLELFGTFLEEYPDFLGILPHVEKKVENEVEKQLSNVQHISKLKSMIVKTCRRLSISVPMTSARESSSFKVPVNDGTKSTTVKAPLSFLEDLVITEEENIGKIVIDGNYCPRLNSLELTSLRKLIEVQLTRLETLHFLKFSKCEHLKSLSATSSLTELEELDLSECPILQEPNLGHLNCLKRIRIESCNIGVPGIFNFKMLRELNINRRPNLYVLCLAHLSCLEKIIVNKCDHLKSVTGVYHLLELLEVSISRCGMLELDLRLEGLNSLKRIKVDRSVKVKCFELIGCKNLETVSGISFEMIQVVKICMCPELKIFPVICGQRCLELIVIDGCGKLNNLTLTGCGILNSVSGNFDLNGLSISDCPMLKDLPSFGCLNYLEGICIIQCASLQNITLPSTLKRLELNSCRKLKTVVGISGLKKLAVLNVKRCPKLPLELNLSSLNQLKRITIVECWSVYNMTLPTTLIGLTVRRCMKLQFKEGIGHLTKLTELHISECPVIEEMPVVCGLSCLKRITIDGWSKFSFLQVADCAILQAVRGNLDMGHLAQLWISDCPELKELPCFAHLTCLVEIHIFRCSKLHKVTLPITLKNLELESCKELKSVSEISCLMNLEKLIICQCGQLELEMHLEAIDSLQSITFDGCGKLNSFVLRKCRNLKSVVGNFDVEWISICGCQELEELSITDCSEPSCFKEINIESCNKLETVTLPVKLTNLIVQHCRHLQRIAGMDDLTELRISECLELGELPSLARLSCLIRLKIDCCQKLNKIILPITLNKLSVHQCRRLSIVGGLDNLTLLTEMYLSECPELEELPSLEKLSYLIMIQIYSCKKLLRIRLPTTLKKLTVQCCRKLQKLEAIGNLSKLTELHISSCPDLGELPVFFGLSSLESIKIDGCGMSDRLKVVDYGIAKGLLHSFDLDHLAQLWISDCAELEELPCFETLTCLQRISIFRCMKLQKITLPLTLMNLHLDSCKELKSVSEISRLINLVELIICQCAQLEFELHLEDMDCLQTIVSDGCGKIKSSQLNKRQNLKKVSGNFDVEWISICGCDELEELSLHDCAGLSCLEKIKIESCGKLQNITLPAKSSNVIVQCCRRLQRIVGMGDLSKLTELHISKCPDLEDLPVCFDLSSLESFTIDGCGKFSHLKLADYGMSKGAACSFDLGHLVQLWVSDCPAVEELACIAHLTCLKRITMVRSTKLQKIKLPVTLKYFHLDSCKELRQVSKMGNLSELTEVYISKCPLIEELPILGGQSCLERITIYSCEKLRKITLPTTLRKLSIQWCRKLQTVAAMGDLTKFTDMCLGQCPELEELPDLAGLSCLESINIDSCERLHNVTLPTTLIKLSLQRCREFPTLRRLSCLKSIFIESCEWLENIQGIEELLVLETIQFLYCSNAVILECISKLMHVPSKFIQVVGRAADGAESNLKTSLLSQTYFEYSDSWSSASDIIIICCVVEVDDTSSAPLHTINKPSEASTWKLNLPQGKFIITTIVTRQNYQQWQYRFFSMGGILRKWHKWSVGEWRPWRIFRALTRFTDKLHQK